MYDEETMHLGQWFHPELNPPAFEHLARNVSDVTDLEMRRKNRRVGNQFHDVSSKLEISRFHAKSIMDRVTFARDKLPTMLADLAADLGCNPDRHRRVATKHTLVIEFRDHVLVAHIEGLLIQTKCLLDSLAQFYSIAVSRSVRTFSDKGKNVLRDLNNLSGKQAEEAIDMAELIDEAKRSWIDDAIKYRDELVHFGQLREFRCLHLPLTTATRYRREDVKDSVMPNETPTTEYATMLLHNLHDFSTKWLCFVFAELRNQHANERPREADGS